MKYSDSDVSVAKAAFAFLLDSYLATHCQDPAGDYLRVLVANRMEGRNGSAQVSEAPSEGGGGHEVAIAPLSQAGPAPLLPPQAPEHDSPPAPKPSSRGAWTPEQRAKAAATRAANKAKKAVGMS